MNLCESLVHQRLSFNNLPCRFQIRISNASPQTCPWPLGPKRGMLGTQGEGSASRGEAEFPMVLNPAWAYNEGLLGARPQPSTFSPVLQHPVGWV